MFNPPNSLPNFDPYEEIEKKMIQRFLSAGLDENITAILKTKYQQELDGMNVMLSRPDRNRLYKAVVKAVLSDLLRKLGD